MESSGRFQTALAVLWIGVALASLAISAPESLTIACLSAREGSLAAICRLGISLVPLILALLMLIRADHITSRQRQFALGFAVLALGIAAADNALLSSVHCDEMQHIHLAWNVHEGGLPYRDFFHHHQLLWLYLTQPLLILFPDNLDILAAGRLVTGLMLMATLGVTAKIAVKLALDPRIPCLLLLAFPPFVLGSVQYRPDPLANLLSMLAVWAALEARPVPAGLAVGLAFITSLKSSLAIVVVLGLLFYLPNRWRAARAFVPAVCLPQAINLAWAAAHGILREHLTYTWYFSLNLYKVYALKGYFNNSRTLELVSYLKESPLIPAVVFTGLLVTIMSPGRLRMLACAGVLCLASFYTSNSLFFHYLLFPEILLALVGAAALTMKAPSSKLMACLPTIALLLLAGSSLLSWAASPPPGSPLSAARIALSACPPGGTYCGASAFECYANPIFRRSTSFYCHPFTAEYGLPLAGLIPPSPLEPPLAAHPPDVILLDEPVKRKQWLSILAAQNALYHDAGENVWVRDR